MIHYPLVMTTIHFVIEHGPVEMMGVFPFKTVIFHIVMLHRFGLFSWLQLRFKASGGPGETCCHQAVFRSVVFDRGLQQSI